MANTEGGRGSMVTVKADELRPFDMIAEGEVIREVTFGAMRPAAWPDRDYPAVLCEVGVLRVEEVETGVPAQPTAKAPAWEGNHHRWFDFGEEVTVMRDWLERL